MTITLQDRATGDLALQPLSGWTPQIMQASVAECLSLITAINRGERFNEVLLVHCAQTGVLQAIVDRMAALSDYED